MKVLLSWLREFAPFDQDAEVLGEVMSDLGMAVEELDTFDAISSLLVARVLETKPHPQADRIQLVDVDAGDGEALQICCGAFNMKAGDLIPLAGLGTVMPNGMEIARRKMRGEWSNGMLCSSTEIGLGSDASGIMILPASLEVGASLTEQLGLSGEAVYDLEINPNRPDAMSVAGVARDLAGRLGVPFAIPEWKANEAGAAVGDSASVVIADPDLCGRFVGRVVRNLELGTSPVERAIRLTLAGMRPINNVVDASNYVMLELGVPSHTYDLALLPDGQIRVDRSPGGEKIITLDGAEREIEAGDGVIYDGKGEPIGLAGVMGGASTEISDDTEAVLLELAWWDPSTISRTSKRMNLRSEASARFERGVDPELQELAAARFVNLLGATADVGVIAEDGNLPAPITVAVRTARASLIMGVEVSDEEVRSELEPIGFACTAIDGGFDVTVPSWRPDSATETDVIEEIARHYGYHRLGKTVPRSPDPGALTQAQSDRRKARHALLGMGLNEVMPHPFLAPDACERAGITESPVLLANPLAAEESVLRPSLMPGMVTTIGYNQSHRLEDISLFEIGHVFHRPLEGQELPDEWENLAVAVAGDDALSAKGLLDALFERMAWPKFSLVADDEIEGVHPTRGARILVGGQACGVVGEVDPAVLEAFGVAGRVAWIELRLDLLLDQETAVAKFETIRRYPSSDVDLAFIVEDSVTAADVEGTLVGAGGDQLVSVKLFDIYRGEHTADGFRSLAYRLRFQALDATLTDGEVANLRTACIDAVAKAHGATLRA